MQLPFLIVHVIGQVHACRPRTIRDMRRRDPFVHARTKMSRAPGSSWHELGQLAVCTLRLNDGTLQYSRVLSIVPKQLCLHLCRLYN